MSESNPDQSIPSIFSAFESINPEVSFLEEETGWLVQTPWGDETVAIQVGKDEAPLVDALNSLRLPPRFTAIWHQDTKDLEFIFGPLPINHDFSSRRFDYNFNGSSYLCEYAEASERLCLIIDAAQPVKPTTDTNHRNLTFTKSFRRVLQKNTGDSKPINLILTSFWIRNVNLSESDAVILARHLNFYMRYFDRSSPMIMIHSEPVIETNTEDPIRYPSGVFPTVIQGRPLDIYLLSLWDSARNAPEPLRDFLHNYQIIEYSAFYYLKEEILQSVKRVLFSPDISTQIDAAAKQILDSIVDDRTSDEAKMVAVIQHYVDPAFIWKEIEPKAAFFSRNTDFDGGFSLPPLIKEGWGLDDFKTAWIPKLPDALRKLRNALVHVREQRISKSIAPTPGNQHRLRPWVTIVSAIATQIIIYREN